jgi:Flp pilus assembly protein TadG
LLEPSVSLFNTLLMSDMCSRDSRTGDSRGVSLARAKSQGGQSLLILALALPMLLGMVGLAFDVGYLEFMRRLAQTAADAGAMAGVSGLPYGTGCASGTPCYAGVMAATTANGFINGSNGVTVTIHNAPTSGAYAGKAAAVEVLVTQTEPTFFLKMIGAGNSSVSARAVAASAAGGCVYTMNPTASGSFSVAIAVFQTNCGIYINSNSASAVNLSFLSLVNTTPARSGVVGGVSTFFSSFTPPPVTGIAPFNDPLAYLTKPTAGSCIATPLTVITTTPQPISPSGGVLGHCLSLTINGSSGSSITLNPGEYNSISASPAFGATVTFNPGTYIIKGGPLNIGPSIAGTFNGSNVTFYLASTAGALTVNGFQFLNFVAPTTGQLAGILFFQDPGNVNTATIDGLNFGVLQGSLYFPKAALNFTGCCTNAQYSILVADTISVQLDLSNTMNVIGSNYSSLPGGSPIKRTVLVE